MLGENTGTPYTLRRSHTQVKRRRLRLLWSYLPDWLLCIGLTGCFYALDYIPGFEREFDLTDTSIQHSFTKHERVPNSMLLIFAGAVPFVTLPIINIITIRSWWDLHNSWLGLVFSLSLTGAVSQVVKVFVGRPRPDLIARCQPIQGAVNAAVYGLSTSKICTQTDVFIMRDGFRSFPSAHSSLSFAGLGFLTFYLSGKLHLFDERGYTSKAWVSLTPLTGAALIAISRTMDYRHHWQDVLTGSTLGLIFSFFAYRQYYPSLSSALSHRPYSPRIPSEKGHPVPLDEEHGHGRGQSFDSSGDASANTLHSGRATPEDDRRYAPVVNSHLAPPPQIILPGKHHQRDNDGESYEMETTSIDGTVKRPRQDLEDVWKQGAPSEDQTVTRP
ncbi:acid phosphatase/Vanadium-dependent haloperoxidase [Serendipita vermifera]|nr:acid phosphatase/Vanadium-dependent haloperoxidase [Serendipita vermifera]